MHTHRIIWGMNLISPLAPLHGTPRAGYTDGGFALRYLGESGGGGGGEAPRGGDGGLGGELLDERAERLALLGLLVQERLRHKQPSNQAMSVTW